MTELTLFDTTPDLTDVPAGPCVVYDKPNRRHGHLLIAAEGADYVFVNDGGGVIRFGHAAVEALQLTEEWTWSWSETLTLDGKPGYGFSVSSREEAEAGADSYMTIVSRLVGPWRTAQKEEQ